MAQLTDTLNGLLEAQAPQIGRRIGADPQKTQAAVQTAVPALLAALGQNATSGGGAALKSALERDHDGSILDNLGDYLGGTAKLNPRATNGAGILEHTLGPRQETMQRAISAKSGLDMGSVGSLLALLAPIVMGMLSKRASGGGTSGTGTSGTGTSGTGTSGTAAGGGIGLDDLTDLLGREKADAQSNPDLGDILGSVLGGGATTGPQQGSGGGLMDMLGGLFGRKSR
jgi:hypothetical protein